MIVKKLTKIAILAFCAAALVTCSVLGTLAYLKATSEVARNTFTIGNVSLSLDETKVDLYGDPVAGAERVLSNKYKLIPNHTYTKDPTVTVAKGSEKCYVRMIVTITDIADMKLVFGEDFLPQDLVDGTWDASTWLTTGVVTDNKDGSYSYEFRYKDIVDAAQDDATLPPLFTKIAIDETISADSLEKLTDMEICIVAHAIQSHGFDNADAAWAAWE